MQRKMIQLSPSTSVVSLPSKWVKGNHLKKGTPLDVNIIDNNVIVSTVKKPSSRQVTVNVSNLEGRLMWMAIDTAYCAGYDSIMVKTKDSEQASFMAKVIRYFPGMMIIDERKNYVHFKSIEESPADFDKILGRIFNLIIALLEDSLYSIKSKDWDEISRVKYRDYIINSYVSYYLRSVNKFGYNPSAKAGIVHTIIKIIEMVADEFCSLIEKSYETRNAKGMDKILTQLIIMVKQLRHVHHHYSLSEIVKLEEERQDLIKILNKSDSNFAPFIKGIKDLFLAVIESEMQINS